MTTLDIVALVALGITLLLGLVMAAWCAYNDGLIGKLALLALTIGAGAPLYESLAANVEYHFLPTTVLFYVGAALFLVRHFYNFMKFRKKNERRARAARRAMTRGGPA